MTPQNDLDVRKQDGSSLLLLAVLAAIVGAAAGILGALFRLSLLRADEWRDAMVRWAQGEKLAGLVVVVIVCAASAAIAAWLVRRFSPHASGSGIPHVEAVLDGELPPAPLSLIPVKFFGGVLAIGSGLALGREGPTVQMGAGIAHIIARICRCDWPACRVLLAAGAGAGLATAFNAPIAGAIFVLEELVRRFEPRIAIAALAASATAISVSRLFLGDAPDFHVEPLQYAHAEISPLFFVLGAVAGCAAIAYNRALLGAIALSDRFNNLPAELRAGMVGAIVGLTAWFVPDLVGGGDVLTQRSLIGGEPLAAIALVFLLRFGLGAISYAAQTPGGLFAPMLVLGAQLGLMFGMICQLAFPGLGIQPAGFAVVGMAAFFAGVVRAPLTGIVLVTEMTANVTMLLPMLGACAVAMLVPAVTGNAPIYDSLKQQTLRLARKDQAEHSARPDPEK